MIGCSVTSSSFSGIWRTCSRLRPASARLSETSQRVRDERWRRGVMLRRHLLGRGRRVEVRVRKTSSSVASRRWTSLAATPAASSARTTSSSGVPGRTGTVTIGPSGRCDGGPSAKRRERRLAGGEVARRGDGHVDALAADARLELVRGARGDHAAVVEHDDVVGEPVGLLEVLGRQQQRRAVARRARAGASHSSLRLCGSSPVVGSSRNSTGGAATSVAARSSRRRMPPEKVFTRRSASLGQARAARAARRRALARRRGGGGRAGRPARGSRAR